MHEFFEIVNESNDERNTFLTWLVIILIFFCILFQKIPYQRSRHMRRVNSANYTLLRIVENEGQT